MMNGMNGMNDANIIVNAHMDDTRKHLKAIRDAEKANGQKTGRLNKLVNGVVNFAKNISTSTDDETSACDTQEMKLSQDKA
jgi:hypothetical protein